MLLMFGLAHSGQKCGSVPHATAASMQWAKCRFYTAHSFFFNVNHVEIYINVQLPIRHRAHIAVLLNF